MTAPMGSNTQYATALPFFPKEGEPNLVGSAEDTARIAYYKLMEDLYHNRPETFQVTMRGDDEDSAPIYIPTARKIVEAVFRFTSVDYNYVVAQDRGTPEEVATLERMIGNLFKREGFWTKFNNNKRYGIIRGDAMWHITADGTKDQGSRISLHELNPANYFPILDEENGDRVVGCHIVDIVQDPREPDDRSKKVARRLTYLRVGVVKSTGPGYEVPPETKLGGVTSETRLFTIGKWDDRNLTGDDIEQVSVAVPLFDLPPAITSIPVYHWRNNPLPGAIFGLSEIAGLETIIQGINQSVTDEDLTLVMQGLGMYWTNAKPPIDPDTNEEMPWALGPGQVIEVGNDNTFGRVSGVSNVAPFQDHMKYLEDAALSATGIPEVAAGRVDVTVAESGISLKLQLAPILAKAEEKNLEILTVNDHFLYDLVAMWLPAFEGVSFSDFGLASVIGDPLPENRESKIQEVMLLQAAGLITIEMAQAELSKLGYTFQTGDNVQVIRDAQAMAQAKAGDEAANRYQQELENRPKPEVGNPVPALADPTATAGLPNVPAIPEPGA